MNAIRIVIAEDETLFRKGMELMLSNFNGVECLSGVSNGQALLDLLNELIPLPDIILLDLKMPVLNGIETAKILAVDYPGIKVIVLSSYFSQSFVLNMIELGAAAYLPKNSDQEEVEKTIRGVAEKGFYYSDPVLNIIKDSLQGKKKPHKLSFEVQITRREHEILQLICKQKTNSEIAEELFISSRTVDGHRMNLLQKLNCRNTAGLVVVAIQEKLVEIDPSQFWS